MLPLLSSLSAFSTPSVHPCHAQNRLGGSANESPGRSRSVDTGKGYNCHIPELGVVRDVVESR